MGRKTNIIAIFLASFGILAGLQANFAVALILGGLLGGGFWVIVRLVSDWITKDTETA